MQWIIVILIMAVCVAYILYRLRKIMRKNRKGGYQCEGCSACHNGGCCEEIIGNQQVTESK